MKGRRWVGGRLEVGMGWPRVDTFFFASFVIIMSKKVPLYLYDKALQVDVILEKFF